MADVLELPAGALPGAAGLVGVFAGDALECAVGLYLGDPAS